MRVAIAGVETVPEVGFNLESDDERSVAGEVALDDGTAGEPGLEFVDADSDEFGVDLFDDPDVDLFDDPDVDEFDDPDVDEFESEGVAHATPWPVVTAAPTPRATANPPTRPMQAEAPIISPKWCMPDLGCHYLIPAALSWESCNLGRQADSLLCRGAAPTSDDFTLHRQCQRHH